MHCKVLFNSFFLFFLFAFFSVLCIAKYYLINYSYYLSIDSINNSETSDRYYLLRPQSHNKPTNQPKIFLTENQPLTKKCKNIFTFFHFLKCPIHGASQRQILANPDEYCVCFVLLFFHIFAMSKR